MTEFIKFDTLSLTHLELDLNKKLDNTRQLIEKIEATADSRWETVMLPLQNQLYLLNQSWGLIGHLQSVKDSPELRELHDKYLPQLTELYVNIGQNDKLYRHINTIKEHQLAELNPEQQQVIANELRDFKLSGISLPPEEQKQFKQIQQQLSESNTKFEHNVLDATDSFSRYASKDELAGIPEDSLALYQSLAQQVNQDGYRITLHMPSYLPLMQYCSNRNLRQELYHAYVTRASELSQDGKFDNTRLIEEILQLRQQKAQLLDFSNYAELSLFNKMADTPQQVLDFLYQLADKSRNFAKNDLAELSEFAKNTDGIAVLEAWDIPYYSEKLQEYKYSYSSQELKQYFPQPTVFNGLFSLIRQLYNLEFTPNPRMTGWHPEVTAYDLTRNGITVGHIYFDLFARDGKQPGAWMNSAQDRYFGNGQQKLPVAYIICNFSQPVGAKPSLLTFDDVQTLFHEMGHGLHHLLTTINNYAISGINGVEWDAVELPSQFMENFAWDYRIIQTITSHVDSGEILPEDFFARVLASRYFQSGLQMLRQLEFAVFDLRLHYDFDVKKGNYLELLDEVRKQIAVIIPPKYNRFANSFSHIFAGGYAAGYYSYKWAEVLACDTFSVFDGAALSEIAQLGQRFEQSILSQGGVRPMMDNFIDFMGRQPQIDALLKYSGMSTN